MRIHATAAVKLITFHKAGAIQPVVAAWLVMQVDTAVAATAVVAPVARSATNVGSRTNRTQQYEVQLRRRRRRRI